MDNSADNKPLNGNNWWAIVENQLSEVRALTEEEIYEKRRHLTLDILRRSGVNGEKRDWDLVMPIPYSLSKEIVEDAKLLDRKRLKIKHFSSYRMNDEEERLFDLLFDYGQTLGIEEVVESVRDQAVREGCTKSQKLYLDYVAAINLDDQDEKGLVNLNIQLTDSNGFRIGQEEKEVGGGSGSGCSGVVIDLDPKRSK